MNGNDNLRVFCEDMKEFICYIGDNVDGAKEESKILLFKLDAAIDLDAYKFCQKFVTELKPHVQKILKKDPTFFTESCKTLPIIKNYTVLDRLVDTTAPDVTKHIWKKLKHLVTIGGYAVESSETASPVRTTDSGFNPESFDPALQQNDIAGLFQQVMPLAMQMMGPMMQQMSGGKFQMPAEQREQMKQQATDFNSPVMQLLNQQLAGGEAPKTQRKSSSTPARPQLSSGEKKKKKNLDNLF